MSSAENSVRSKIQKSDEKLLTLRKLQSLYEDKTIPCEIIIRYLSMGIYIYINWKSLYEEETAKKFIKISKTQRH